MKVLKAIQVVTATATIASRFTDMQINVPVDESLFAKHYESLFAKH